MLTFHRATSGILEGILTDYVSVKSKLIVQIPPSPGQNAVQMPHTRVHSGEQLPPPRGHFTGTKMTEGQQKRLQLSNKIFIHTANNSHSILQKLRSTVSVFTMNKSLVQSGGNRCFKVTEGSEFLRVLRNIQRVHYKIIRPIEITTS